MAARGRLADFLPQQAGPFCAPGIGVLDPQLQSEARASQQSPVSDLTLLWRTEDGGAQAGGRPPASTLAVQRFFIRGTPLPSVVWALFHVEQVESDPPFHVEHRSVALVVLRNC